jgi:alpha-methylacyl-CoA racemase
MTFVEVEGVVQPGPVPRFSRTPAAVHKPPSVAGADAVAALQSWGIDESRITALRQSGAVD